jgi:transposase
LRSFGIKIGMIRTIKLEARIRELSRTFPIVPICPYWIERLLVVRRAIREQVGILYSRLLVIVENQDQKASAA